MKALILVILLVAGGSSAIAQGRPQPQLKRELDSIYLVDQRWRSMLFDPRISRRPDSLAAALGVPRDKLGGYIIRQMQRTDSTNLLRVRAILQKHGYPGKSLVGEPTNEAVWLVVQHSDEIDKHLPKIRKAALKGELPFRLYAQMLDRQLMRSGKEQLYGTQARNYNVTNPTTRQRESQPPFVWPIKDPANVNERRRKAGFPTTVEQSAAQMGILYRVVTLQDVANMPKN